MAVQKGKEALNRLKNTSEAFQRATEKFSEPFLAVAQGNQGGPTCSAKVSRDVLIAYTATVVELVAAAKNFEESTAVFAPSSARKKFRDAIQNLETGWANFWSISDGRANGDALGPYLNAAAEYIQAQSTFFKAFTASLEKKAKRMGFR
jgi:hypothetical protein